MKKLLIILFVAFYGFSFAQKAQDPDTLLWNDRRYAIVIEPYVPSPLMVYFQTSGTTSPFNFWSSNNNRGHVATYEILNDALYLRTIEAKRYRTRHGNLWTESGIDTVVTPDFFEITPLDSTSYFSSDAILTDWFTGVLRLTLLSRDKKESRTTEADGSRYLFLRNGRITENIFVSSSDLSKLDKNPSNPNLKPQRDILNQYEAYVDFFARCCMDREPVSFSGHDGLFERKPNSLTLVLLYYNNNPFRFFSNCSNNQISGAAPFGQWLIRNDSLFLTKITSHSGKDVFSFTVGDVDMHNFLADSVKDGVPYGGRRLGDDGTAFADWITGDFVVHYGTWEKITLDVPVYTISKTQTLRIVNGIVTSSQFSPSSFEDDLRAAETTSFSVCDQSAIYSVDDKQLAESVGDYKHPKKNPTYWGDKPTFRSWFLNNPLTDERAKNRLFRVRLAFMVNCKGEVGQWRIISKGKGELYEFANTVLELVKTMPHKWSPATDRKGNPVDCWQIMEFTVSDGILTNGNYK